MGEELITFGEKKCTQIADWNEFDEIVDAFYGDYFSLYNIPSLVADREWNNDAKYTFSIESGDNEEYGYSEEITAYLDGTDKSQPSCYAFLCELDDLGFIEEFDGLVRVAW